MFYRVSIWGMRNSNLNFIEVGGLSTPHLLRQSRKFAEIRINKEEKVFGWREGIE